MKVDKSEIQLACELVKVLDGVPINLATNALNHAIILLSSTQVVSAKSPLLLAKDETNRALNQKPPEPTGRFVPSKFVGTR
jgi:hypothetical protein